MNDTDVTSYDGLMHAGAGTALALVQLSALIPGLLPTLALLGLIAAVVLAPLLGLALAAAVVLAPPVGVWRLATRKRRERQRQPRATASLSRAAGPLRRSAARQSPS